MAKTKKDSIEEIAEPVVTLEETTEVPKEEVVVFEAVCLGYVIHNKVVYVPGDSIELTNQEDYNRLLELNVAE